MTKGERIRTRRMRLCISQTDLANAVKISKQTLYKYENDIVTNIPSDVIEKLSYYLECSPAYIMGWDGAQEPMMTRSFDASMSDEDHKILVAYRKASPDTQRAVRAVLGIAEQGGQQS